MKYIIGLMSGTSLDGVDAALIRTDGVEISGFGPGETRAYSEDERRILFNAVKAATQWNFQGNAPDFSAVEKILTKTHAEAVRAVIEKSGLSQEDIDLIGFHGQTVLHRAPNGNEKGKTLQVGDGQALADELGIDVVYDFRSADVDAGGQGAPLVPLYHEALTQKSKLDGPLAIINLGGVANVTWIEDGEPPIAFDTGPANGLLDEFVSSRMPAKYDEEGRLAGHGRINLEALTELMDHPYFSQKPPKSLDRWDFSLKPVLELNDFDACATLTAFTARTIAGALSDLGKPKRLLITGGGRKNPTMMRMLAAAFGVAPEGVEAVGWRGDLLEAEAFAWLAARVEAGLHTSLPSTTGVPQPVSGGIIARFDPKAFDESKAVSTANTGSLCPVCGFGLAKGAYVDGVIEDTSCSCCGTNFGIDDVEKSHAFLRDKWVTGGMKWTSESGKPPAGWNPVVQLVAFSKPN